MNSVRWQEIRIFHFIHHAIQHFKPDQSSDDTLSITRRIIYLSLGYILPLAFTLAAHFLGVLGQAGRWCWLKDNSWTGKGFQIGEYAVTYFFNYYEFLLYDCGSERPL